MATLNLSEYFRGDREYKNLTRLSFEGNDKLLVEQGEDYSDFTDQEWEATDGDEEKAAWIREQDFFYELLDNYDPQVYYGHLLESTPSDGEIAKILEHATNVSLVAIEDLDASFIALNGGGMDLSDIIAYAYMVVDKVIPASLMPNSVDTEFHSLTDEAAVELRKFCFGAKFDAEPDDNGPSM